jgi:hypothetical protein
MTAIRLHRHQAICLGTLLVGATVGAAAAHPTATQDRPGVSATPQSSPIPADAEIERFLSQAHILRTHGTKKGITDTLRATLSDGVLTHDAHIQVIDEYKREFRTNMGVEFDFRDSWMFNVAAYKIDRLIGLNMVPVSIAGRFQSKPAAITWWVDDVLMDEGARLKNKANSPEPLSWARQMTMVRLFDQLIYNTDRNVGNLLIDKDWRIWPIDHTRAFRKFTTLKTPESVSRCDRAVFARLKALQLADLTREVGKLLDDGQIRAILSRRDAIVAKLEGRGPEAFFSREVPPSAR